MALINETVDSKAKRTVKTPTNSKPYLIAIIGPSGVGKSTQVKLLSSTLSGKVKIKKNILTSNHLFAFVLYRLLLALGLSSDFRYPGGEIVKVVRSEILPKSSLKWLWWELEWVSIIVKTFFEIYLPMWFGYFVVSDGFIVSQCAVIIDLQKHGFMSKLSAKKIIAFLFRFIPDNSFFIFLDAPANVLRGRYVNRQSALELERYTTDQEMFCDYIIKNYEGLKINNSHISITETLGIIIDFLDLKFDFTSRGQL